MLARVVVSKKPGGHEDRVVIGRRRGGAVGSAVGVGATNDAADGVHAFTFK